jgi:hypothetical protein
MSLEQVWADMSDRELASAMSRLSEYTQEAQQAIRNEAQRRAMSKTSGPDSDPPDHPSDQPMDLKGIYIGRGATDVPAPGAALSLPGVQSSPAGAAAARGHHHA